MKHTAEGLCFITNKLPVNWCLLILYPQAKSSVLRELTIWRRSNETWDFSEQRTVGKIWYLLILLFIFFFLQLLISDIIPSFIQSLIFEQWAPSLQPKWSKWISCCINLKCLFFRSLSNKISQFNVKGHNKCNPPSRCEWCIKDRMGKMYKLEKYSTTQKS